MGCGAAPPVPSAPPPAPIYSGQKVVFFGDTNPAAYVIGGLSSNAIGYSISRCCFCDEPTSSIVTIERLSDGSWLTDRTNTFQNVWIQRPRYTIRD